MSEDAFNDRTGNDDTETFDADLRKLQEERDNLFQQLARVQADFKNARQRLESDKQQQIQYANSNLLKALIPAIDNFERALEVDAKKTDTTSILKGMQMVHDQLIRALAQQEVEVIAPEPGDAFDPNLHAAIMQQPSDKYKEPVVTQLLQKGYAFHGRTLRPAQVAVSKVPESAQEQE